MKKLVRNIIGATIALPFSAQATNIEDLALECYGTYQVDSSHPYFISNEGTRALPRAGTSETITVLSQEGKDCQKLATFYGVQLDVGQQLAYGIGTGGSYEAAVAAAENRIGKVFSYAVSQSFTYVGIHGKLPLFPVVHSEEATLLGVSGQADAAGLYGSTPVEDLTIEHKRQLLDIVAVNLDYGKVFQSRLPGNFGAFLGLLPDLQPDLGSPEMASFINTLLLIFNNVSKYSGGFVTFAPGVHLGNQVNALLNAGQVEDERKLRIWQRYPLLFDAQIVSWGRISREYSIPQPDSEQITEILIYSKELSERLANVPEVVEARMKLAQHQHQARTLLKYYDLDETQASLAQEIVDLR